LKNDNEKLSTITEKENDNRTITKNQNTISQNDNKSGSYINKLYDSENDDNHNLSNFQEYNDDEYSYQNNNQYNRRDELSDEEFEENEQEENEENYEEEQEEYDEKEEKNLDTRNKHSEYVYLKLIKEKKFTIMIQIKKMK